MCIRFIKVYGFIKFSDKKTYLVLFVPEKYGVICSRISFFINLKTGVANARIKTDSYDSLPLEKTLNLHNIIITVILVKLVFTKDQNNNYYNIFFKKYLFELIKK